MTIEKKLRIAEIFAIVVMIITAAIFIGDLKARVSYLESQLQTIPGRVVLENKVSELDNQVNNLTQKLSNLEKNFLGTNFVNEFQLCNKGGGAQKIKINDNSLAISIDEFWEKGTKVSLQVDSPSQLSGKPTITKVLKAGETEKVVFDEKIYALTVTYIEEPCVKISIERIKED